MGYLLWMKHSLSCAHYFCKTATEVELTGNLSLLHRPHLLAALLYIRLVQCLFKQLSKYIKRSSVHESQCLKKIVTVPTQKDFNNHLSVSWI